MKNFRFLILALLLTTNVYAVSRPNHQHEDLFGEDDLLFGFKVGPQLSGYTTIQTGGAFVSVQSSMRALGGASVQFIYPLPRIELDFLFSARGGINSGQTLYFISTPVLAKLPYEIEKNVDVELGIGAQPDLLVVNDAINGPVSAAKYNQWLISAVASLGVAIDLTDYVFNFEVRYNFSFDNISPDINGASPRDVQVLGGLLWHF